MLMLGSKDTIDQLAMANSVRWYGHVLRREDGLKKGNRFWSWKSKEEGEAEEDMERAGWGRKCEGWFGKERCTLRSKVECRCKQDYC